jgi:ABC-type spermidine/putrescine transport system permease subunit I
MLSRHNWPLASAFAIMLVAIISVVIMASRRLMDTRTTFHA